MTTDPTGTGADRYDARLTAPMTPATATELRRRLETGTVPRRTVTPTGGPPCTWPDCLTPEQSAELCDDIGVEMRGGTAPVRDDKREECGCREEAPTDLPANVHPTTDPTGGPEIIRAPWTSEQVDALNRWQRFGGMHPFTCGAEHSQGTPRLVALEDGWHCWMPWCDYRQDWAHAFMADPEALPNPDSPNSADPGAFRHAITTALRTAPPAPTVTVTVHAATPGDSASRAQAIADLVVAEFGEGTRIDVRVELPAATEANQ